MDAVDLFYYFLLVALFGLVVVHPSVQLVSPKIDRWHAGCCDQSLLGEKWPCVEPRGFNRFLRLCIR